MITSVETSLSRSSTCVLLTALVVGAAMVMTWGEFAYLQRQPGRRPRIRSLPDARLGVFAGLVLIGCSWSPSLRSAALLLVVAMVALFASRVQYGREGADEIALIVAVGIALTASPLSTSVMSQAGLIFIAAQLALAYAASGGAKLLGSKWRDGHAIAQILSTRDYGLGRRDLFASRSPILRLLAWATVAFELCLPVALVFGGRCALVALLLGALFHISVAVAMGLNRFAPWFVAAYPSGAWAALHFGLLAH